jgi:hypothetical protein
MTGDKTFGVTAHIKTGLCGTKEKNIELGYSCTEIEMTLGTVREFLFTRWEG